MNKKIALSLVCLSMPFLAFGQNKAVEKFKQLNEDLPTPNVYRTAGGAPGHAYYQQKADYKISVELNDEKQIIYGEETITYTNNSPDVLDYLWLQLDQNNRAKEGIVRDITQNSLDDSESFSSLERIHYDFDGGFNIEYVKDRKNKDLPYTINETIKIRWKIRD